MSQQVLVPDVELKARHRAMWASGDYPAVAAQVIPDLGAVLVAASGTGPGQRVLDVAAGSGNAAIPAALTGAEVTASDLTPELLEAGREVAARRGAVLSWDPGDAEALPYGDATFDVVMSCVGVMFAPHHHAAADELLRVARPGGTVGLVSWTPEGFIGRMLGTLRPHAPAPPPGAQSPVLWGDPAHVVELLGERVTDLTMQRRTLRVDRFASPLEFREFFKATYGPTIAVYRAIGADADTAAAVDRALDELAAAHQDSRGVMEWEYLLVTARRT
jgi:SAM-dependent methyltransferase